MMLSDFRKAYEDFSGRASDVARAAALGGIAVVWLFRIEQSPIPQVPQELLGPLFCCVAALALDLLQYIAGTAIWGIFHAVQERRLSNVRKDVAMDCPSCLEYPILALFVLKMVAIVWAYVLLLDYLRDVWSL